MNLKKLTLLALICSLCISSLSSDLHAQRRKRNPGNEKEQTIKKDSYDITILLPHDGNAKSKDANNSILSFYEGVKLGLNDLDKEGIKLTVQTQVLDQTKTLNFSNFAYIRELKNTDLIIAPISGPIINDIAHFANEEKINFISTLSPYNGSEASNNYFHILQPTLQTNINNLAQYIKQQFPKNRKIIIYSKKDAQNYDYMKEALKGDKNIVNYDLDVVNMDVSLFTKQLKPNEPNVVYLTSVNPTQTEEILKVLTKVPESYQLEIVGMPTLNYNTRIKQKNNPNISYYFSSAFYFDANTAFIKKINQDYKTKYNKPANDMVYRGYETIVWYARVLNKYGTQFQFSRYDNMDSPYTPFSIKEVRNENNHAKYYENKYLFINKYNNGVLHIIEQ